MVQITFSSFTQRRGNVCFVIFKYHLIGILTVFEWISNKQTKKTENDGTFFGADYSG